MSTASCSTSCARSFPERRSSSASCSRSGSPASSADLNNVERYVYYVTLIATAVALVLLMAPAAHHRLRFREGDKDYLLRKGNREAIAGTVAIAIAFTGVIYLITELVFGQWEAIVASTVFFVFAAWRWWSLALYRSLRRGD